MVEAMDRMITVITATLFSCWELVCLLIVVLFRFGTLVSGFARFVRTVLQSLFRNIPKHVLNFWHYQHVLFLGGQPGLVNDCT